MNLKCQTVDQKEKRIDKNKTGLLSRKYRSLWLAPVFCGGSTCFLFKDLTKITLILIPTFLGNFKNFQMKSFLRAALLFGCVRL